jgi:hypothetical protein
MVDVKKLECVAAAIEARRDDRGWCKIFLIKNRKRLRIGAETKEVLKKRLTDFLENRRHLDAAPTRCKWVTTLADGHFSIYAKASTNGQTLMVQDSDAGAVAEIPLTENEAAEWLWHLRTW